MIFDDDERYYDVHDAQSDYEAELIDEAVEELSLDRVRSYLGTYGDAVQARVDYCLGEAEELLDIGHFGPSLALAFTAAEIIIRFFVVRPLVQGAFLSDEWATILAKTLLSNRPADDRNLVNKVAGMWKLDLQQLKLSDGSNLWQAFTGDIIPKRNGFIHKAQRMDKGVAVLALDCSKTLMKDLVPAIATKAGLSWPESGSWNKVLQGVGGGQFFTTYEPQSPFNE